MTSEEIRKKFLDFFTNKNHKIVPSAPIVIQDDPTLMFTNAGMNQFKAFFLGLKEPKDPRVADTQKCLRVSGKHNDLEEVGKDTYHHTMFEMLGNWSFGDYFKKEAISWAWELLTEEYKIPEENLYVTVFEGSTDNDKLERDEEALQIWKGIVSDAQILFGDKKDNFWEMGDQGPCGPCSEIHVDLRSKEEKEKVPGASLVNKDHPEVIELWNLVFIQYNRKANGQLENLPQKHIDTGMGFERLCMVLQGKTSNYDTDLFSPLIEEIAKLTGIAYGEQDKSDVAMRVIADHLRAVCFAIADGQLPSNTGAGYVIRRILRRAIRYGFTFLNIEQPFMHSLVPVLTGVMGKAFPELHGQQKLISNVIREEENSFLNTLEQGLLRLDAMIETEKGGVISGKKAFELYDTFGFPIDLTSLILEEKGLTLDVEGFDKAMGEQKKRSKSASEIDTGDWTVLSDSADQQFIGYDQLQAKVKLHKYRQVSSKNKLDHFQLVFNCTPFYPEGGGQVGDQGYLESADGERIDVLDTKRENEEIVHLTQKLPKDPEGEFTLKVNPEKRRLTARNHTATHLLHQALREILGPHVEQKGSSVQADYLRFDFSHFSKVSEEELNEIEEFVNARIADNLPLEERRNTSMEKAIEEGAIALFGEKYGDTVRTVRFGKSLELCGGTHVPNTADIWNFKIISEGAIAAGIRRIEAITSNAAKQYFIEKEAKLEAISALFKGSQNPLEAVKSLQAENARLQKELEVLQKSQAAQLKGQIKSSLLTSGAISYLTQKVSLPPAAVKDLAFSMGKEVDPLILVLGSEHQGKALLAVFISKSLVDEKVFHAGDIVKELAPMIKGGGGGQPFYATAGGTDVKGIDKALEHAAQLISEKI